MADVTSRSRSNQGRWTSSSLKTVRTLSPPKSGSLTQRADPPLSGEPAPTPLQKQEGVQTPCLVGPLLRGGLERGLDLSGGLEGEDLLRQDVSLLFRPLADDATCAQDGGGAYGELAQTEGDEHRNE